MLSFLHWHLGSCVSVVISLWVQRQALGWLWEEVPAAHVHGGWFGRAAEAQVGWLTVSPTVLIFSRVVIYLLVLDFIFNYVCLFMALCTRVQCPWVGERGCWELSSIPLQEQGLLPAEPSSS